MKNIRKPHLSQCMVQSFSLHVCFPVVSLEGRAVHLATLVQEAEQRVSELQVQVGGEAPGEREVSDRDRQLKAWEWRLRLFRRMQTGFEHASKTLHNFDIFLSRLCCSLFWFPGIPSAASIASTPGSPLYEHSFSALLPCFFLRVLGDS